MENQYQQLEWPSKRIPPGGVLHCPKSKCSPETQKMMRIFMEESKLTLSQRRQVDWCLRTGSSLSEIRNNVHQNRPKNSSINRVNVIMSRNPPKKRSLSAIIASGSFERDGYVPNYRIENREQIKQELQDIMEFGKCEQPLKNKSAPSVRKSKVEPISSSEDAIYDLMLQIKDRAEWLEDMETLGEGALHREDIHHQIAERIKRINALKDANVTSYSTKSDKSSRRSIANDVQSLADDLSHRLELKDDNCKGKTRENRDYDEHVSDILSICSAGKRQSSRGKR